MTRDMLQAVKDGAMDALLLYAALISAPFFIAKAFLTRPPGVPFNWRYPSH